MVAVVEVAGDDDGNDTFVESSPFDGDALSAADDYENDDAAANAITAAAAEGHRGRRWRHEQLGRGGAGAVGRAAAESASSYSSSSSSAAAAAAAAAAACACEPARRAPTRPHCFAEQLGGCCLRGRGDGW